MKRLIFADARKKNVAGSMRIWIREPEQERLRRRPSLIDSKTKSSNDYLIVKRKTRAFPIHTSPWTIWTDAVGVDAFEDILPQTLTKGSAQK